jgi:hypothetical protein
MKRHITLLLILSSNFLFSQTFTRPQLRESFLVFRSDKVYRDSIVNVFDKLKRRTPDEECYMGICVAFRIKEQKSNWDKLKLVFKARNHLNNGVSRQPNDPELRYLRFAFEHYLPSFLGLNKHVEDDLAMIIARMNFVDDNPRLKKMVLAFLLKTKRCTEVQNQRIKAELDKLPADL